MMGMANTIFLAGKIINENLKQFIYLKYFY